MHRAVVFLNHRAGQHQKTNWRHAIETALFRSELSFVPLSDSEAFQAALSAIRMNQFDTIITVGGDGTMHSVIPAAAGSNARLLVLPGGTANDLSNQLGHHLNIEKSLELVRLDRWKSIDLIDVNGELMATNGGIGLVGDVAESVERYRNRIPAFMRLMSHVGHRIYSAVLGVKLLKGEMAPFKFDIRSKEFSGTVETPIILVNNQPNLAGSFPVAPQTSNQDGLFNVTIFFHQGLVDLAMAIDRVRRHIPPTYDPNIVSFETKEIVIRKAEKDAATQFFGDGEFMGTSDEFNVSIRPQALRVLIDPSVSLSPFKTCAETTSL